MATVLEYLNDTYLFNLTAEFLEIKESDKGTAVILQKTIFYPQGGGQPSDTGVISTNDAQFIVSDVRLDEEGAVWHYGYFEKGSFNSGEVVSLEINKERRMLNARLHSCGHLIDAAVEKLGLLDSLVPGKAFQFPPEPYIEYEGEVENLADLIQPVQKITNELVDQDLLITAKMLTEQEAEAMGMYVPKGKPARFVTIEGFTGMGCGGTHVASTKEIGAVTIKNIKAKKGITKIFYSIE